MFLALVYNKKKKVLAFYFLLWCHLQLLILIDMEVGNYTLCYTYKKN